MREIIGGLHFVIDRCLKQQSVCSFKCDTSLFPTGYSHTLQVRQKNYGALQHGLMYDDVERHYHVIANLNSAVTKRYTKIC